MIRFILPVFLLLAGMLGAPAPATAQQQQMATPVILVVDIQRILQESAAAKAIQAQLGKQREVYQQEISTQEEKLRAADQELARQRTILSQEAFAQKRREFESQVADVQRTVQARKRALDQAFNESMAQVHKTLLQIVADVAAEHKANLVLAKQQVVLAEKSLEVTDSVLNRLNKTLPTVQVSVPKS